jgi:hypothetical protein
MTRLDTEREELKNFSLDIVSGSARSLELLRAIDGTLSWLVRLTENFYTDAKFAVSATEDILSLPNQIDGDHEITGTLENAQAAVYEVYELLIRKRGFARSDKQLKLEDGVDTAFTEAIVAAAELHNVLNELRWALLEHDADLSPISRPYSDSGELLKALAA